MFEVVKKYEKVNQLDDQVTLRVIQQKKNGRLQAVIAFGDSVALKMGWSPGDGIVVAVGRGGFDDGIFRLVKDNDDPDSYILAGKHTSSANLHINIPSLKLGFSEPIKRRAIQCEQGVTREGRKSLFLLHGLWEEEERENV